jgi:hypothetical protein
MEFLVATRREFLKWSMGTTGAFVAGVPFYADAQGQVSIAVVAAKTSPIQQLSQFELKKLYLGANINDPSGERIIAFNQAPNSPDRVAFENKVLGMTPEEVARYWIDRKIRGEGGAPKAVPSVELLQRVVSKMEHSVAYVRLDQIRPEVRIVAIDGAVPGDPAYRLFA